MHTYAHVRELVAASHVVDDAEAETNRVSGGTDAQHQGVADLLDLLRVVLWQ
jgi:hypothetical protein